MAVPHSQSGAHHVVWQAANPLLTLFCLRHRKVALSGDRSRADTTLSTTGAQQVSHLGGYG